jgi:hypothetical protein
MGFFGVGRELCDGIAVVTWKLRGSGAQGLACVRLSVRRSWPGSLPLFQLLLLSSSSLSFLFSSIVDL